MTIPSKTFPQDGQITEHFNLSEFACNGKHCCDGAAPISFDLVASLEDLRNLVNGPIKVNSGFRCRKHNAAVGGAKFSTHMLGLAADLRTPQGLTPLKFANLARRVGFGKVIVYSWGIHVDVRTW
jgi:zinc D-Ala-D-Ala carboxypeptidase